MGTVLQWRKFNFFDINEDIDNGKIADALKDADIVCTGFGRGIVYIGDSKGWIHCITRHLHITSFHTHGSPVKIIYVLDQTTLIISVGGDEETPSEVKVWSPDRYNSQGLPLCVRTIRPDPRPLHSLSKGQSETLPCPAVTALSVSSNITLLALGFSDGSIMLYRGDVSRERGSKGKVVVTFSSGAVTNLHFHHSQKNTHLFVTTVNRTYCINCTAKDKEKTIELDTLGCKPRCAAMADGKHDHEFLVARTDAIYCYTQDSRRSCYVFEGEKIQLNWFRGYLVVAAQDPTQFKRFVTVTVYDPVNKLVAFTTSLNGLNGIIGEWGGLYLVTQKPSLTHIHEKDLQSKFELLFRKNQFDIAISIAKMQCCDNEEIAEILKQYGDWLYTKGNVTAAMEQYIKTIPHLEPSYVIKKYLDTKHINSLTSYLHALHKSGHATSDHITLMLNCYTRLRDAKQLDQFFMGDDGTINCDVDLGIRVCRGAGYFNHALTLASKHKMHHHYLAILIEDMKDYLAALRYIGTLNFEEAKSSIISYGTVLLSHFPEETVDFLVQLCTNYKPSNELLTNQGKSLDMYITSVEPVCGDPEDFEHLLVNHSDCTAAFLERLMHVRKLSTKLNTTLLAELLHQYSLAPEGQDQNTIGIKILDMLRNEDITVNQDHALLLCDKYNFTSGKLVLWEKASMFEELMTWYAEQSDFNGVVRVCETNGEKNMALWPLALKLMTSYSSVSEPDPQDLGKVLQKIESENLLPSLEVVDLLASSPHVLLGQVRDYLLRVVNNQNNTLAQEAATAFQYKQEIQKMKEIVENLSSGATEFTGTKCNICNNSLFIPSVHFLCKHSFHKHCFESYSENENECPKCHSENKKLREIIASQENDICNPDILQEQLQGSTDLFSVVADFVGKGLFAKYNSSTDMHSSAAKLQRSLDPLQALHSPLSKSTERTTEARLRLQEGHHQGGVSLTTEGRLRQQVKPLEYQMGISDVKVFSINVPSSSEARIESKEGMSSLPGSEFPSTNPPQSSHKAGKLEFDSYDRHSASRGSCNISDIALAAATESKSDILDNPFEDAGDILNPFHEGFETEELSSNPFVEEYDDSKNPFADDECSSEQISSIQSKRESIASTPYDDYDPSLNPFAEN